MATTFTVNGVSYSALSTSQGKYALDPFVWSPLQKVQRFHANGVTGNFTVLSGSTGGSISCRVRYVNTETGVYSDYESDVNAMINTSFSVTSPGGTTYTRCKLTGSNISFGPKALNDGTQLCYMDATFQIYSDGGAG